MIHMKSSWKVLVGEIVLEFLQPASINISLWIRILPGKGQITRQTIHQIPLRQDWIRKILNFHHQLDSVLPTIHMVFSSSTNHSQVGPAIPRLHLLDLAISGCWEEANESPQDRSCQPQGAGATMWNTPGRLASWNILDYCHYCRYCNGISKRYLYMGYRWW